MVAGRQTMSPRHRPNGMREGKHRALPEKSKTKWLQGYCPGARANDFTGFSNDAMSMVIRVIVM